MTSLDYINTLGAGAGFDTKKIVEALVEAERAPKEARLQARIDKSEAQISALSQALSSYSDFKEKVKLLNDTSDFNNYSATSNQSTVLTAEASSSAIAGSHSITVSSLAREQRTNLTPNGGTVYSSKDQLLNSGISFSLAISIGNSAPVSHTVSVSETTPEGIVNAINDAKLDVSAQLIDKGTTGTDYIIQLVGESGAEQQFSVTPSVNNLIDANTPSGQTAADASLTVNGVSFTRSSNSISDLIQGTVLTLNGTTTGAANVAITRDLSSIEANIEDFVEAFNTTKSIFRQLTDRETSGALAGDSIFKNTFAGITNILLDNSSTVGKTFSRLSDMGITFNKTGDLQLDKTSLSEAIASNIADVVTILSGDTQDQTNIGEAARGLAGDLYKYLEDQEASTAYFATREKSLADDIADQETAMEDLEDKLASLQDRYTKQFSAMNALIDEMNNTKDNLVSTFDNLPFTKRD